MSLVALDTDVASALLKNRLPPSYVRALHHRSWCVTFVTVAELWQWADIRGWGAPARDRLERWLDPLPVIQTDDGVNRTWAEIAAYARRRGRARPSNDSWMAACCLAKDTPLATMNVRDYLDYVEYEGLRLVGS